MSVAATGISYTPEDLLNLPDGDRYELVDGQLVERDIGFRSGRIGGELYRLISTYCREQQLGWALPGEVGYQCFPDAPNRVRKPDAAFIRADRLGTEDEPDGHCPIAPDLAVEVVSPNDLFDEVTEKVEEYLGAGVRLVWVVDPGVQLVQIYRADGTGSILRASDELTGEDVLPGFRCRVAEVFAPPPGVA